MNRAAYEASNASHSPKHLSSTSTTWTGELILYYHACAAVYLQPTAPLTIPTHPQTLQPHSHNQYTRCVSHNVLMLVL